MSNVTKGLIALSAIAFVMAVASGLMGGGPVIGVGPEGFSRACSNLALISIALTLGWKNGSSSQ